MDTQTKPSPSAHETASLMLLIDKYKDQFPRGLPVVWGYEDTETPEKGVIFCARNSIWLHPSTWPRNEREHLFEIHANGVVVWMQGTEYIGEGWWRWDPFYESFIT